jgi:hypothetical protein
MMLVRDFTGPGCRCVLAVGGDLEDVGSSEAARPAADGAVALRSLSRARSVT